MNAVTKHDVRLLARIGKLLGEEAAVVKRSNEPWSSSSESVAQKRRYDRILREQRDLADLRERLTEQVVP